MKTKALFLFSVFMIVTTGLQAASQAHAPKKVEEQSVKAQEQSAPVQPAVQKSDCEQPVTDSIGLAMAAGAAAGVAWGAVDAILFNRFQPKSVTGLTLMSGMRFISFVATLEVLRNYMEENKKVRLPRFFLYSTTLLMNTVVALAFSPIQPKITYNNGVPTITPVVASAQAPAGQAAAPAVSVASRAATQLK